MFLHLSICSQGAERCCDVTSWYRTPPPKQHLPPPHPRDSTPPLLPRTAPPSPGQHTAPALPKDRTSPPRQHLPPGRHPPPPVNKQAVCILLECFLVCCHRPQTEVCEGYVFTGVCLSTGEGLCSGGVSVQGSLCSCRKGGSLSGPPYGSVRAVRILVECILVILNLIDQLKREDVGSSFYFETKPQGESTHGNYGPL